MTLADIWQVREAGRRIIMETAEKISPVGLANSAARLLPAGTVILSRTASVGFPAILGTAMATSQDFVGWICGPHLRPEYLYHVLLAMAPELRRLMMGSTHQTIYMPDIHDLVTPLPPRPEQDRIVAYLDRETARIDALIAAKERLLELLAEKRAALITEATTKGLDPTVPMKPSGTPWLGDVPAHWSVLPLRRYVQSMCDGPFGSALKNEHYTETGVPVIRLQNIGQDHWVDGSPAFIDTEYFHSLGRHDARAGDLGLVDKRGLRNT